MGVLGLTPFLQKTCPEVIKRLPDRLRSLRGRTIVIDGTLITQRLHYAPMPHQHRHVLGWHRILTELKEYDVRAICVFDGKERSTAKMREIERRREHRKVDAARGFIETRRLDRLHKLTRLLPRYYSLSTSDRQRITKVLSKVSEDRSPPPLFLQDLTVPSAADTVDAISAPQRPRTTFSGAAREVSFTDYRTSYLVAHGTSEEEELQDVIASNGLTPCALRQYESHSVRSSDGAQDRASHISDDPYANALVMSRNDDILDSVPSWSQEVPNTQASGDVESELSTLYHEYRQCVAQLTSMPSPYEIPLAPRSVHANEDQVEYAMSKQQLQMTLDEGRIWSSLSVSSNMPPPPEAETTLSSLAEKSTVISQSYQRRCNPPSLETYEESKEMVRAMGVPCIESTGPFEAEALASSLVIHGLADYVASEDTDVLVYEAPLIRNLTSRDSPLLLVSGADIRTTLRLDRSSYIDFNLLLGTDFSQRIKNVGPHRALKFIRAHGSIERVIAHESKYLPRVPVPDYLEQVEVARLVFRTLPPVPPNELLQPTEESPAAVSDIIQKYRLHRVLHNSWECQTALAGNYFDDNPTAI